MESFELQILFSESIQILSINTLIYRQEDGAWNLVSMTRNNVKEMLVLSVIVIKFLLNYLKKGSFKIFAIYRVIIGIMVIAWLIIK